MGHVILKKARTSAAKSRGEQTEYGEHSKLWRIKRERLDSEGQSRKRLTGWNTILRVSSPERRM